MAIIEIEGLEVFAHHGLLPEERRLGGRFVLDIRAEVARCRAEDTDRLEDAVDYARMAALAEQVAQAESYHLLERLAAAVADRLMREFPLDSARVRVTKLSVPIPQRVGRISVTVER